MAESETLSACPFCGCDKAPVELGNQYEENFKFQCVDCKATTGRYRTRPDAIKAWNQRAGAPERGATDGKAVGCSAWLGELFRLWKLRVPRFYHDATMAASKGDYGEALRKTSMAEATELCISDLRYQSSSTAR